MCVYSFRRGLPCDGLIPRIRSFTKCLQTKTLKKRPSSTRTVNPQIDRQIFPYHHPCNQPNSIRNTLQCTKFTLYNFLYFPGSSFFLYPSTFFRIPFTKLSSLIARGEFVKCNSIIIGNESNWPLTMPLNACRIFTLQSLLCVITVNGHRYFFQT